MEMLRQWLEDDAKTVGALIGIGGQGKTYLAAKFAENGMRPKGSGRIFIRPYENFIINFGLKP